MTTTVPPFETRRRELVERAVARFSSDARFPAGWLEGSLADGSADSFSDIDLYLCVDEKVWEQVWPNRRNIVEELAPILTCAEIRGIFAVACLMEGPIKLDVFFERESTLASHSRIAIKPLWGPADLFERMKLGDDLGDTAIAAALGFNIFGFLQGATWPVRILARGQIDTFLYNEILLVETAIVPLMLLERDRRAFHRNPFTRAKLLPREQQSECSALVERIVTSVRAGDRSAMRDLHIEIFTKICALSRRAFDRYHLEFPARVEDEMVAFYQREWPLAR